MPWRPEGDRFEVVLALRWRPLWPSACPLPASVPRLDRAAVDGEYGLSWQIVPKALFEMYGSGVSAKSERAMKAMPQMKKLDLAALQKAYDGADR